MKKLAQSKKYNLHVVAFDIPYPVNYGGAIDILYKIKNLSELGINIYLHCFQYGGRKPSIELESICHKVFYYPRKRFASDPSEIFPYIVNSRKNELLLNNLSEYKFPIIFEGLHTCYYLSNQKLRHRKKIVRLHNIEHEYYKYLAKYEKNYFKKMYYLSEAQTLKWFEKNLKYANLITTISNNDYDYYRKIFSNVVLLHPFHINDDVNIKEGIGKYALYHGSLEVNENHYAALFLIDKVFSTLRYPLIIAGNKPKKELVDKVKRFKNISLKTELSTEQITALVRDAQINILPTFQPTGIKLKLILALFNGRHCLVNSHMIKNTGLDSLCHVANTPSEFQDKIVELVDKYFTQNDIGHRREVLEQNYFFNKKNAQFLIKKIFD